MFKAGIVVVQMVFTLALLLKSALSVGNLESDNILAKPSQDNVISASSTDRAVNCGGVFNSSSSGFSHKPFEQVVEHERCSWIIGVPEAVGYLMDIQFLGSPTNLAGSGQELVVTTIRWRKWEEGPILTPYQPTSTGYLRLDDCNIIVVTFHSSVKNTSSSNGFALRYESIFVGNITKTSPLSTHHIIEVPTFDLMYPSTTGANYQDYELAAFVFSTMDNIYAARKKHLLYEEQRIQDNCYDTLHVFTYSANTTTDTGKWQSDGWICHGGEGTRHYISHDDMVMIIFTSDERHTYAGIGSFTLMGC